MDYGDSLKTALIRKINKAERDLAQLKLDYCRFVYGISHRSKVAVGEVLYQVKAVDLESMIRDEMGDWSRPRLSGVELNSDHLPKNDEVKQISADWELVN